MWKMRKFSFQTEKLVHAFMFSRFCKLLQIISKLTSAWSEFSSLYRYMQIWTYYLCSLCGIQVQNSFTFKTLLLVHKILNGLCKSFNYSQNSQIFVSWGALSCCGPVLFFFLPADFRLITTVSIFKPSKPFYSHRSILS